MPPVGCSGCLRNFYPRPPRGGRREENKYTDEDKEISIHALREEGDQRAVTDLRAANLFLSTPSARRATVAGLLVDYTIRISIHALREEGDLPA